MGLFSRKPSQTTADLEQEVLAAPARSIVLTKSTGPATDRQVVLTKGGIDFTKKFDSAGTALAHAGLTGMRAESVLIVDHSGSMSNVYAQGKVQTLVDRALAFTLQIDVDGKIPVIPFDSRLWPTITVDLDTYAGVVARDIWKPNKMGGTYLAPALRIVLAMAKVSEFPIHCTLVTDDDPSDRAEVSKVLAELRRYPVFVKVLTLVNAPYWLGIDTLVVPGTIDNLNSQVVRDPAALTDAVFAGIMTEEWPEWFVKAQAARILR